MARMWQMLPFEPISAVFGSDIFDMRQALGRIDSTRHKRNPLPLLSH